METKDQFKFRRIFKKKEEEKNNKFKLGKLEFGLSGIINRRA